jgi:hypothetical protein
MIVESCQLCFSFFRFCLLTLKLIISCSHLAGTLGVVWKRDQNAGFPLFLVALSSRTSVARRH